MAGLGLVAKTPSPTACSAGSAKTILQVAAPTNQALIFRGFSATFDGATNTATPGLVEVCRQSTAGTSTGSVTPVKSPNSEPAETIQSTSSYGMTVEPTTGDIVWSEHVHPQWGKRFDWAPDKPIRIPGGSRIAIRCNFPAAVNCQAEIDYEE